MQVIKLDASALPLPSFKFLLRLPPHFFLFLFLSLCPRPPASPTSVAPPLIGMHSIQQPETNHSLGRRSEELHVFLEEQFIREVDEIRRQEAQSELQRNADHDDPDSDLPGLGSVGGGSRTAVILKGAARNPETRIGRADRTEVSILWPHQCADVKQCNRFFGSIAWGLKVGVLGLVLAVAAAHFVLVKAATPRTFYPKIS